MNIEIVTPAEVLVHRTIQLEVGKKYRINSSYGFAGIEDGIVEITDIDYIDNLETVPNEIATVHADVSVSMADGMEEADYMANTLWVVAEYGNSDDIVVLPIEDFVDHISVL